MKIGARYQDNGTCRFTVWAPFQKQVFLKTLTPNEELIPMLKDAQGYWHVTLEKRLPVKP